MLRTHATAGELGALAPLAGLSADRLAELAELAVVERAPRGSDPLRGREPGRSVFLLQGELLLYFEGGGGVLVPARDEGALSDAMLRYFRDGGLRASDGKRARERACAEFDATTHAARIREQIGIAVFGESSHERARP